MTGNVRLASFTTIIQLSVLFLDSTVIMGIEI